MLSPNASGQEATGTYPSLNSPIHSRSKAGQRANSGMFQHKKSSVLDRSARGLHNNSDTGMLSPVRNARNKKKAFGFRNHSHALGSTLRHFSTITDFPELPASVTKHKVNEQQLLEWQKKTKRKLPEIMEALKKDPRALEIFMDELAMAD